jgi:RimJ/RimL family protein N-acetyltransferase
MNFYKVLNKIVINIGEFSLVPIRYQDRLDIMNWRNQQIYHLRQEKPLTIDDQERYFKDIVEPLFKSENPNQILFSFLKGDKCIGYGGLVHINWIDKNAEISFIIDTDLERDYFYEYWKIYLVLIEQLAFNNVGLHKIYTYAYDIRPHLFQVLLDSSYIEEASLFEHVLIDGIYKNVRIHSKFNKLI